MKKLFVTIVFILLTLNLSFGLEEDIRICVNGEYLLFDESSDTHSINLNGETVIVDTTAMIENSNTYISSKETFESLGYDIYWDSDLQTIFINKKTDANLGLNLSHNHYWSTQWMFVDFIKQSWVWMPQDMDERNWEIDGIDIPVDSNGYPTEVPFMYNNKPHKVHTLMFFDNEFEELKYPVGVYHLYFEGDGEIILDGDVDRLHFSEPNIYHEVNIANPTKYGINLIINRSNKDDPIRNIKFIMPGFKDTHEINPYHPKFLKFIEPIDTLRFMKSLYVEEFETVAWEDRTTRDYFTQSDMSKGGLSYDYIIDLCNRTGKNPWINLPYRVDDAYVKKLALFIRDNLRKDLKIYIEYSNEPFNSMYDVYNYSIEQGVSEGITDKSNHLIGAKYAAKRSIEIFDIIDDILEEDRFVSLLSCEFFNIEQGKATLEIINDVKYNPNQVKIDSIAIAPYFGGEIANDIGDRITKDLSLNNIFNLLSQELDTLIYDRLKEYRDLADEYKVDLIAYEAGQHFVSLFYPKDDLLIKLMKEVNYDNRM